MEGRESKIPCIDGITTLLFEVREKAFDDIDGEVFDRHLRGFNRVALGQKVKEQSQGITIASLGVNTQVAIDAGMLTQTPKDFFKLLAGHGAPSARGKKRRVSTGRLGQGLSRCAVGFKCPAQHPAYGDDP